MKKGKLDMSGIAKFVGT